MPEHTVTHEQLRAGQMALIDRFDRHERQFESVTGKLFEKADIAADAAHRNSLALSEISGKVAVMFETRNGQIERLTNAESSIKVLEKAHNINQGERGVWAAIARNPAIAWLVTALAGAWAIITHAGAIKP